MAGLPDTDSRRQARPLDDPTGLLASRARRRRPHPLVRAGRGLFHLTLWLVLLALLVLGLIVVGSWYHHALFALRLS